MNILKVVVRNYSKFDFLCGLIWVIIFGWLCGDYSLFFLVTNYAAFLFGAGIGGVILYLLGKR